MRTGWTRVAFFVGSAFTAGFGDIFLVCCRKYRHVNDKNQYLCSVECLEQLIKALFLVITGLSFNRVHLAELDFDDRLQRWISQENLVELFVAENKQHSM